MSLWCLNFIALVFVVMYFMTHFTDMLGALSKANLEATLKKLSDEQLDAISEQSPLYSELSYASEREINRRRNEEILAKHQRDK